MPIEALSMVAIGSRVWAWPSPMPFDRPREARLNDVFADRDLGFRQLREIRTDSRTHDLGLDPGNLVWLFPFPSCLSPTKPSQLSRSHSVSALLAGISMSQRRGAYHLTG